MAQKKIQRSDLPFGSEFSPSQIELPRVLELAHEYRDDWKLFEDSVKNEYFLQNETSEYNRKKLANNTKLGMIAYKLIDREANLTDLGLELFNIRGNVDKLYRRFAKHILLNLHGLNMIQCILDIQASGETVDLLKLRKWLEERGIHFPRGGKHPSMMRLWLEKAGIFVSGWRVNEARLNEIVGTSTEELEILATFSPEQKAFLKTLANMGGSGSFYSNEVEKLASATYGVNFNEKNLPKQVLYPLQEAGYITLKRGTQSKGRGAKPFKVSPTEKLAADIIAPILQQLEKQLQSDIRPLLRKDFEQILNDLDSRKRHLKGLALEALAFKLMRLVDMDYVATRLRGNVTGGAEVDVIFESSRLVFSRWQVQCKNTTQVSLDDVAKEVGLTHFLKSNVIVIVSTGKIGSEARKYANKVMTESNLCIVMVDGNDIAEITKAPPSIVNIFNREAKQAMKLKALAI